MDMQLKINTYGQYTDTNINRHSNLNQRLYLYQQICNINCSVYKHKILVLLINLAIDQGLLLCILMWLVKISPY